ncbi:Beta-adducin [Bagarius yarrelli]|uniref:Beta-adducin n=1 Tax=Bagarius yarrelli TaxID=175774 RepID=A0A556VVT5_BAGYA|nr:Beta-adducin [Bagarius yarrelli]
MSTSSTPVGTPVQRSPVDGECVVMDAVQSPPQQSFREELDMLIQEQSKKGGSSSSLWALRQIADFMASHGSPAMRISKEQEHFLVLPEGLTYGEVTASNLVKVNILGDVIEQGSTTLGVDVSSFSLHSAIYSTRPDVSAMKCGLLPLSHEALLVGEVAYYDYNGVMEEEEDRVNLQKSLGPTCKVLVLRNHGFVALGESLEEAFYTIYHIQTACQIQVSALCCAGGEENLIMLDRNIHRPNTTGSVGWAGSTFGPMHKTRLGEHEFEALMRTLDNLGYRTGYAYRFPVLLERSRTRREVEVPATVTSFSFDDDGKRVQVRPQPHAHKQQLEKTRWLNTPNTYQKVNQEQASPGHRTTWLRTDEVTQSGGTAIKIENPNQFVPLFTNPQEVLETRNKIREQNRQDAKTAGPQSQLLAGVITENSPPALEDYHKEVQAKQLVLDDGEEVMNDTGTSPPASSPTKVPSPTKPPVSETDGKNIPNGKQEEEQGEKQQEELEKGLKALSTSDTSESSVIPPSVPPTKPVGTTPEERRRSRSSSRDRERRRRERERERERSRSRERDRDRDRRRSRSRSPHRRRSRSPRRHRSSSLSPLRQKDRREEERKEVKEKPVKVHQISAEDMQGKTEEEIEMMKLMGFGSFDTTKGRKVDGSVNAHAINVTQKRKYSFLRLYIFISIEKLPSLLSLNMAAIGMVQMLIEAAEYLDRREREAEHGYASTLPFTSHKDRDGSKKKNKSKKNCSSRSTHNEMEKNRLQPAHHPQPTNEGQGSHQEELDVDVEGTDYLLGDLEWSTSSVSDSDERGSLRSSCSDEGYSSHVSLRRLASTQEKTLSL